MERKGKSMKPPIHLLISAGFILLATLNVLAGDVKVIANNSVKADTISSRDLKNVFLLQRKTLDDGSAVVPVLAKSGVTHESFLRMYLDRGSDEIHTYYQGLVFTGKGLMPKELNSEADVVEYVAKTKGAIGYVSSSTKIEGVKILTVVSEKRSQERVLLTRVEPDYPETLQRLGIGGIVRLRLTISRKGEVESIAVVGGNPILAEAAEKAVKQWVYSPSPTQTSVEVAIPFETHH
jgi:TonB family protein